MIPKEGNLTTRMQQLNSNVQGASQKTSRPGSTHGSSQLSQDYLRFSQSLGQRAQLKAVQESSSLGLRKSTNTISSSLTASGYMTQTGGAGSSSSRPQTTSSVHMQHPNKENKPVNTSSRVAAAQHMHAAAAKAYNSSGGAHDGRQDPVLVATQLQATIQAPSDLATKQRQQQHYHLQASSSSSQFDIMAIKEKINQIQEVFSMQYRSHQMMQQQRIHQQDQAQRSQRDQANKSQTQLTAQQLSGSMAQSTSQNAKRAATKAQPSLDILHKRRSNNQTASLSSSNQHHATLTAQTANTSSLQTNRSSQNTQIASVSEFQLHQKQHQLRTSSTLQAPQQHGNSQPNIQIVQPQSQQTSNQAGYQKPVFLQGGSGQTPHALHKSLAVLEKSTKLQLQSNGSVSRRSQNTSREPVSQQQRGVRNNVEKLQASTFQSFQEPNKPSMSQIQRATAQPQEDNTAQPVVSKRSRTSEHTQHNSGTYASTQAAATNQTKFKSSLSSINQSSAVQLAATPSIQQSQSVTQICSARKRDRLKTLQRTLEVCDYMDMRNLQSVAEFAPKITQHLLREEQKYLLPAKFMKNQRHVTEKMRALTVDWLAELHYKFKMWPETLYVCIGVMDQFLAKQTEIRREHMQTLGIACLHIAGKYEEIYPPDLRTILHITNQSDVTKEQVLRMEQQILTTLQFEVTFPSIFRFIERFGRLAQINDRQLLLANYLADTAMLDCSLVREHPSRVAACCVYAVQFIYKGNQSKGVLWPSTMAKNTPYRESDISQMAHDLIIFVKRVEKSQFEQFRKKYSSQRYGEIAKMLHNVAAPAARDS